MKKTINCTICKDIITGKVYKLSLTIICSSCNDKDYINSIETGNILGIHRSSVSRYVLEKRRQVIPINDATRGTKNLLWRRETILKFRENLPQISKSKVDELLAQGLSMEQVAVVLKVDVLYVHRTRRTNIGNKNAWKSHRKHQDNVSGEGGREEYNLANKLFNKCLNNTLTL